MKAKHQLLTLTILCLVLVANAVAGNINISGWVGDASGVGVAGVEVALKDSSFSTTTDESGNWSLVREATIALHNPHALSQNPVGHEFVYNILGRKKEGSNLAHGVYMIRDAAGISSVQTRNLAKAGAAVDSLILSYQGAKVGRIGIANLTAGVLLDMTLRMVNPLLVPETAGTAPSPFYMLVGQTAQISYSYDVLLWRPTWLTVGTEKNAATGKNFSILLTNATDAVTLELASRAQNITFATLSDKTYGDANFLLNATASSALDVAFTSKTPLVCKVSGVMVSIVSKGECLIQADQAGDANFNAATSITQSFTVAPKVITVVGAVATSKEYDGTTAVVLTGETLSGVVGTDDVTLVVGTATFVDANVGIGKAVAGCTLSGISATNYTLTEISGLTADITAKQLSINGAVATNKVYDGTTAVILTGGTLAGVVGTDDVTLTVGTATFADKNVGTGKVVTVTGSTLSGTLAKNYTLTEISGLTADITAKQLSINGAVATNKVYDGTTAVILTGGTLAGVVGTDDVTLTAGTATFADKNVGTGKVVTVTGSTLSGTLAKNYTLTEISGLTADITAKQLSINGAVATSREYNGTAIAIITGATLSGKVGTNDVTLTVGTATFADKNVGTGKVVTVTGSTLSGTLAKNYTLTEISGLTADITAKPITVTADTQWKLSGAADPAVFTYKILGSLASGDAFTGVLTRNVGETIGTYYAITQSTLALSSNYILTYVGANMGIKNNQTCPYNSTNKTLLCAEKTYNTVTIGSQVWMAENLNYAPAGGNSWSYATTYGRLYDYPTALLMCPAGWHLPDTSAWNTLETTVGGDEIAGTKLKSQSDWNTGTGYSAGTNSSNFSALPGGDYYNSSFLNVGNNGYWWTATSDGGSYTYARSMRYNTANVDLNYLPQNLGASVRCLKD